MPSISIGSNGNILSPPNSSPILIDGKAYVWSDAIFAFGSNVLKVLQQNVTSIDGFAFGSSVEQTEVYGAGQYAIALAEGKIKFDDVTFKMYASEWENILSQLQGGRDTLYKSKEFFNLSFQYYSPAISESVYSITAALKFKSDKFAPKNEAAALMSELTFACFRMNSYRS